ncbi:MAG: hypothetical protein WCS33_05475 [Candidatus Caldatribacteriota bacterium]|jgi:hypothetical protein
MILYNASQSKGLRNFTRFLTNSNSTTYTDADVDASLNMYYHDIVNQILESMDGWDFQGEIATANLVASQQEYVLPTDILKIKRIEITYDGTTWNKARFFDISEDPDPTDSTTITRNFSTNDPYVDLHDNSVFLFPVPTANVSAGIKIWYEKEATELSSATSEPVFAEAYHKILCYGAAKDYFEKYADVEGNTNKRNLQQQNYNRMLEDLKTFYNTKNQDRDYEIKPYFVDYDYNPNSN